MVYSREPGLAGRKLLVFPQAPILGRGSSAARELSRGHSVKRSNKVLQAVRPWASRSFFFHARELRRLPNDKGRPLGRPFVVLFDPLLLCEPEVTLAPAAVGHEAHAQEAQDHHCPGRRLRSSGHTAGGGKAKIDQFQIHKTQGVSGRHGNRGDSLTGPVNCFHTEWAEESIVSDRPGECKAAIIRQRNCHITISRKGALGGKGGVI
jgi:hypothetical protein